MLLMTLLGLSMLTLKLKAYSYEFDYNAAGNRISRTVITISAGISDSLASEEVLKQEDLMSKILCENIFNEMSITIYPNPTKSELIFKINPVDSEIKGSISLFTMEGNLIFNTELHEINTINLTGQPPGNYLLHVNLNESKKIYKISKQ